MIEQLDELKRDIARGNLCLKADEYARFRFQFVVDGVTIGCYAIRSTGPFEVRVERAWNIARYVWDIEKKLMVPCKAQRQFGRIKQDSKIVIRELMPRGDIERDRVSFTFAALAFLDGPAKRDEKGCPLLFEIADLQGVKFNG